MEAGGSCCGVLDKGMIGVRARKMQYAIDNEGMRDWRRLGNELQELEDDTTIPCPIGVIVNCSISNLPIC